MRVQGGTNMSINIQAKTDVSYLFSSLGSGASGVAGSNFLSDYASIKNGSYAKLMKAYYSENASDSVKTVAKNSKAASTALSSEESKAYAKVQTNTDALKESADALLGKSLFEKKDITTKDENGVESTVRDYDKNAIYEVVNNFVNDYNSVMKAVTDTDDSTVSRRVTSLTNETVSNLLVTYTHSLWEEGTARPHGGSTWKQSEPENAVGDRLCNNRRVGYHFSCLKRM